MGRWPRSLRRCGLAGGEKLPPTLTAMSTSAPMRRATSAGTLFNTPPSTSTRPSISTGEKKPGSAMVARTAAATGPSQSTTSSRATRSTATTAVRRRRSPKLSPPSSDASHSSVLDSLKMPRVTSKGDARRPRARRPHIRSVSSASWAGLMPLAYRAAIRPPMLVPTTRSIGMPSSSSTRSSPMWASPRAPPPPRASPIVGLSIMCRRPPPHAARHRPTGPRRRPGPMTPREQQGVPSRALNAQHLPAATARQGPGICPAGARTARAALPSSGTPSLRRRAPPPGRGHCGAREGTEGALSQGRPLAPPLSRRGVPHPGRGAPCAPEPRPSRASQ